MADNSRVITVRGLCDSTVMADKVTWPIVSKEVGNDLATIYANIQRTNNAITDFLKRNGVRQEEIAVNAPAVIDMQADRFNSQPAPFRYNVTTVVVVTSDRVKEINALISRQSELLKEGIAIVAGDYQYQTSYEFTGLNTIKPGMIAEATRNARAAARKFADDSDSRLGKIKTAQQGQFSIEDRDQYTPYMKNIRVVTTVEYYLKN